MSNNFDIVLKGIDSAYIGFYADFPGDTLESLAELKSRARELDSALDFGMLGKYKFKLQPHGAKRYKYILSNDLMMISINQRVEGDAYPNVRVQLYANYLWTRGADKAYKQLREILDEIGEVRKEVLSRIDMAVDMTGIEGTFKNYNRFENMIISRARKINITTTHREINSWTIGSRSSKIYCRCYDKSLEIKETGKKSWFWQLWGLEPESADVWRIEFELKREILKEFDIETWKDFRAVAGDVWKYLTDEWLQLKKNDNSNTTRRTTVYFWDKIKELKGFFGMEQGVERTIERKGTLEKLFNAVRGYTTSIGTILGIEDVESAIALIKTVLSDELDQSTYDMEIRRKLPNYQTLSMFAAA